MIGNNDHARSVATTQTASKETSSFLIFSLPLCIIVALSGLHRSFLELELGASSNGVADGWSAPRRLLFRDGAPTMQSDEDAADRRPPKVLYTIFAGRKNRLLLQEPYWLEMYQAGAITEMHMWNYVTGFGGEEEKAENLAYLHSLPQKYPFITIMDPRNVPMNETRWFDTSRAFREEKVASIDEDYGTIHLKEPHYRGYSEYYKYYATHPYDGAATGLESSLLSAAHTEISNTRRPAIPVDRYISGHFLVLLQSTE